MGKPSPPPAPDPVAMSKAQGASNVDTATASARLNAVNQTTPYGSVNYDTIGTENIGGNAVPQYRQTVTLSPAEQQKLDQTNALTGQALTTAGKGLSNAQQTLSTPFNLDNVPQLPGTNDFSADRQRVTDALMGRFNQDFPKQQEDVISRMNAEGLQRGSAAYDTGMDTLNRSQVDAKNAAIAAGGAEQSRLFGLAGQARQQGVSDAALVRNQPINEFATLLGLGGQVQAPTGAPNFNANVNPTDVLGAYGMQQQALQNSYNQKMGANNAMMGALGNVAGKAVPFLF